MLSTEIEKRAVSRAYDILMDLAQRRRLRLAQLDGNPAQRTCTRCGGDAHLEGDFWRCWNCDATEPVDG